MTEPEAPDLDRDLWVVVSGFEGRCYLLGNGHTSPGRMAVWSERAWHDRQHLTVGHRGKLRPRRGAGWRDSLHGNEPTAAEFLGIDAARVP